MPRRLSKYCKKESQHTVKRREVVEQFAYLMDVAPQLYYNEHNSYHRHLYSFFFVLLFHLMRQTFFPERTGFCLLVAVYPTHRSGCGAATKVASFTVNAEPASSLINISSSGTASAKLAMQNGTCASILENYKIFSLGMPHIPR